MDVALERWEPLTLRPGVDPRPDIWPRVWRSRRLTGAGWADASLTSISSLKRERTRYPRASVRDLPETTEASLCW
jgi:hypothetical protein